jgi:hypothetical protein
MALGWTQGLTEVSTRNLLEGCKGWMVPKADSLVAICEAIVKFGSVDVPKPDGAPCPFTGISWITSLCALSVIWGRYSKYLHADSHVLINLSKYKEMD